MAPSSHLRNSFHDAGASDSEDDLLATANVGANSRRTNNKTSTGIKAKSMAPRRTSSAAKRKAAPKTQNRQALKDRTNIQAASDTEEVEDFEDEDGAKPKSKRAKTTTAAKTARVTNAPAAKSRTTKRAAATETLSVIPETQPDPDYQQDDISQSIEFADGDDMDITNVPTPPKANRYMQRARSTSVQPAQQLLPRPSARSASAQPGYPPPRERSGSASATERRGGDPELRRKLNEMTKKYENLDLKYQNLQEIGETAALSNFEKLKRASDQKTRDSDALIAGLKKELADVKKNAANTSKNTADAKESEALHKQVSSLTASNSGLATENANLKSSLQVSQNEVKSLEAKLVAARQQLSSMTSAQETTKNAADAKSSLGRSVGPTASDAQKEAKMKENLYSDLTGLIIRGIKRKEGEDEYDCLQTGRNGTLHFHLSIATDASAPNPRTPSGLSYEDTEFAYEPLLDEGRDKDLIDILPDYLTEEICFPRNHAVKFYTRVVDSMTKKIVVEE